MSEELARSIAVSAPRARVRILVATASLTPRARAALRSADLSWIERDTGRCRLSAPGMLLELDVSADAQVVANTSRVRPAKAPPALLRDRSGLIAESLLIHSHKEPVALTSIAAQAGLSRALTSRLLARLTSLGVLEAYGRAPRKHWMLRDAGALLDLWAVEERTEPENVVGISAWSRTPSDLLARIAGLRDTSFRCILGGTAAANLHAPTLSAAPIPDLWIPAHVPPARLASQLDGQLVDSGANVRVLQHAGDVAQRHAQSLPVTRETDSRIWVISAYRAYVEARRSAGRGPDAADALRRTLPLYPTADSANA